MAMEIERKFLLTNDDWRQDIEKSIDMIQGYLGGNDKSSIRIRIDDESANLNIKGKTIGIQRKEFDYPIPLDEARELMQLCDQPLIEKTRHIVRHGEHIWEIDEFESENKGLIVAEVELNNAEEALALPDWIGDEVTNDVRYYNICLVNKPYSKW